MGKLSNRELAARQAIAQINARVETTGKLINAAVRLAKYAAWVGGVYFVSSAIASYAGSKTELIAIFDATFKMGADRWVAYTVAGLATGSWWYERRLRRRVAANQADKIKKLEQEKDPGRSTSGLALSGVPEDPDDESDQGKNQ